MTDQVDVFWCSDPSLGNMADWTSAVAAVVAALGTVLGVAFAYRRYRESLADKKRDQARFVHAVTDRVLVRREGSAFRLGLTLIGQPIHDPLTLLADSEHNAFEYVPMMDVALVEVTVTNGSREIIIDVSGDLWQIAGTVDQRRKLGELPVIKTVVPGASVSHLVVIPWSLEASDLIGLDPRIEFTDSAGNHWERQTSKPVKSLAMR